MTDTPIRTHATTTVGGSGMPYAFLPSGWEPGTPVLVVAGLPEGATIKRLCDVPEGWEWQLLGGDWSDMNVDDAHENHTFLVVCRPVPVPAPPATERVPWWEALRDRRRVPHPDAPKASERRVWSGGPLAARDDDDDEGGPFLNGWTFALDENGYGGSWSGPSIPVDADGMVEVLVEAPTGDDEPPKAAGIPLYAMLDVWMALGGDPSAFDRMLTEDRRTNADTWAQLLGAIRGSDLSEDTNPPAGPEFDDLLNGRRVLATPAEIKGALFDAVSSPHGFVVDRYRARIRDINSDGMVEVLVEDAPVDIDDEPHDCTSCTTSWEGCNAELGETGTVCCSACKVKVTHGQTLVHDLRALRAMSDEAR